jgi:ribonuclease G
VSRQVIINSNPEEVRVAVTENARLLDLFIERRHEQGLAGSIYKGRVTRVLPGIQAAFVDIGLPKAAFLHVSDVFAPTDDERFTNEEPASPLDQPGDRTAIPGANGGVLAPIEQRLAKGQELLVQIVKEPIGTKGARVSANVALPGRYLVLLPLTDHLAVSRRIESPEERERLIRAIQTLRPRSGGLIIRTASEGVSKREIQADLRFLRKLWERIAIKAEGLAAPALLHHELDVILRTLRDLFTSDVSRVLIDDPRAHQRAVEFMEAILPNSRRRIDLYAHPEPIFERYGIEAQIARALDRRVWLKCGGYIVIDHTEALTAIDVNSGRFVGTTNQEETALQTNLEAARVIVDQLRLRHVGGLIVIDFIDMEKAEHRKQVLNALTDAVKRDKVRCNILGFSELGLVEMTRKRTRENLLHRLCEPCSSCGGAGWVKSPATVALDILRRVRREATMNPPLHHVAVTVPPPLAAHLRRHAARALQELQQDLGIEIVIRQASHLASDQFEVTVVAQPRPTQPPQTERRTG